MTSSIRLLIVAEGVTEETFVGKILTPHLSARAIYPSARLVEFSRTKARIYRGGLLKYAAAKRDILLLLQEDPTIYVTTMFDLYALPTTFPMYELAKQPTDPKERIKILEEGLRADINNDRFIPYIQLHEYEALLFSDISKIDYVMKTLQGESHLTKLERIMTQFPSPELINDGPTTAPSKRLLEIYSTYDKVLSGSLIAQEIGLSTIRKECPHFNSWLETLENLQQ